MTWTTVTGRPHHGSEDLLSGTADGSGIVAVEIPQLGGDVLADPFARHFQGVLFVQVLLKDVHQAAFVGGRKLSHDGHLTSIGSGIVSPFRLLFVSTLLAQAPRPHDRTAGVAAASVLTTIVLSRPHHVLPSRSPEPERQSKRANAAHRGTCLARYQLAVATP